MLATDSQDSAEEEHCAGDRHENHNSDAVEVVVPWPEKKVNTPQQQGHRTGQIQQGPHQGSVISCQLSEVKQICGHWIVTAGPEVATQRARHRHAAALIQAGHQNGRTRSMRYFLLPPLIVLGLAGCVDVHEHPTPQQCSTWKPIFRNKCDP